MYSLNNGLVNAWLTMVVRGCPKSVRKWSLFCPCCKMGTVKITAVLQGQTRLSGLIGAAAQQRRGHPNQNSFFC